MASSPQTALAIIQAAPMSREARNAKPSKKDKERYLLSRRGWSMESLAARENVKEHVIKQSIDKYQLYRDSLAVDEQDLAISEMTSRLMPKAESVLSEAMKATHSINVGKGDRVIMRKVADHATRMEAVKTVKSFIETGRPKGGGIQVNTQINNPGAVQAVAGAAKGFDFESHLRDIRAAKGLGNEMVTIDGSLDEDEDGGLSAELDEIGIELDEDEDDVEDGEFDEDEGDGDDE